MQDHGRMAALPAAPDAQSPPHPYAGGAPPAGRPLLATLLRTPFTAQAARDYLYILVSAPLALAAFVALVSFSFVAALLSITIVGIPLFALIVLAAREYGAVPRGLVRELLHQPVEAPRRRRPKARGFFPWLGASLSDLDGWRAIAHVVIAFPFMVFGAWLVATATVMSLALFTYPVWWHVFEPTNTGPDGVVHQSGMQFGEFYIDTWPRAIGLSLLGLAALFVMPWLARAFTTIDRLLVQGLLGPTRISERVEDLEATRAHAVDDSAATLRRIERDLHDGTQARLVALAMHLDMAKEKLASDGAAGSDDPDIARARELLDQAHSNATEAITELRDVTRSIHPPALDRGLDEALATLVARSGVPARVVTRLSVRPSPAIETIAYYCVAELLTNVAKHSAATHASVEVTDSGGVLYLRVTDGGRGGAGIVEGRGLAGLTERVRTVDGRLTLSSPVGGPTVVVVELPLGV
jgi:signal transduction histidine kinase